jgi:hypothetical protein
LGTLAEIIAPDVPWHVPGDNLLSGTCTSRDGMFGCFSKIFELSGSSCLAQLPAGLQDAWTEGPAWNEFWS